MKIIKWKRMPITNPITGYCSVVHNAGAEVFQEYIAPAEKVSDAIKSINQLIAKILKIET